MFWYFEDIYFVTTMFNIKSSSVYGISAIIIRIKNSNFNSDWISKDIYNMLRKKIDLREQNSFKKLFTSEDFGSLWNFIILLGLAEVGSVRTGALMVCEE